MSARSKQQKKKGGVAKVLLILLAVVSIIAIGVYIAGVIYFQQHFFYRTTVGNTDVSFMDVDTSVNTLSNATNTYKIKITAPGDKVYEVKSKDISMSLASNAKATVEKEIKSQNVFTWPLSLIQPEHKEIKVEYSDSKLHKQLEDLLSLTKDPVNATITINDDNYKVVEAKYGADTAAVQKEIDDAIDHQNYQLTLNTANFTAPEITSNSEQITNAVKKIESYLKSTVSYTIGSSKKVMDKASVLKVLSISDTYDVTVDDTKLQAYVEELASNFNTYGKVRTFRTQAGDDIQIGGGDYGYILDKDSEFTQLKSDLESGKMVERQPMWSQTAQGTLENDIGDTYVELDYTNQVMYYVLHGERVFTSDIVSGNINMGSGSPDGVFRIKYRVTNTRLKGTDYDGSEYDSPVNYFIVFAYNIGFHDASWQPWFGGNRYTYAGSKGCINLPNDSAAYMNANVPNDIAVVAYYRYPVNLTGTANANSNAYSYHG